MSVALYNTIYNEVLPDVPGVTQAVALNAIRNAVIELLDRTKIYVVDHADVDSVANQATYSFVPPSGYVVCGVADVTYNGVDITPITKTELQELYRDWSTLSGTPTNYYQESTESITLFRIPESVIADAITMKVALKPTRASTGVESWIIEQYIEEIAHGAKARLFAMQKKPWSDPGLSAFHADTFDTAIAKAATFAAKGLGRGRLRTKPQFF